LLITGPAAIAPLALDGQDPRPIVTSNVDHVLPSERSIAERVARIDAAAVVRVLGAGRARAIDVAPFLRAENPGIDFPAMMSVYTEHEVVVTEALRAHLSVVTGGTITVSRTGGRVSTARVDSVTESSSTRFDLVAGGHYVIFLTYNELLATWETNAFDLFRLDGDVVGLTDDGALTEYGRELRRLTPAQAVEAVRRAARDAGAAASAPQ
jgi:hypothetical protein